MTRNGGTANYTPKSLNVERRNILQNFETERDRDRQTDRQRQTDRDRQTERKREGMLKSSLKKI